MGRTACTEPQCLYKGDLYLYLYTIHLRSVRVGFQMANKVALWQVFSEHSSLPLSLYQCSVIIHSSIFCITLATNAIGTQYMQNTPTRISLPPSSQANSGLFWSTEVPYSFPHHISSKSFSMCHAIYSQVFQMLFFI